MTLISYDPKKHARLLAEYCLYAQPNERLLISSSTSALPLVREINCALLEAGARPELRLNYPEQQADWATYGSDAVLDAVHSAEKEDAASFDGRLKILTPEETPDSDATRRARFSASRAALLQASAGKKWALTLFPTAHAAKQAGMSQAEFEDFVMRAMFLDRADPVVAWQEVRTMQATLIERISKANEIKIQSDHADLTLRVDGRTWANSDGRRNMPSGEIFTGPLEQSANGWVYFDIPAEYSGAMVRGARLEWKDGKVIAATAEEGEATLLAALETDEGARFLGEIGIGTNYGIQHAIGNILFDEKIGGTVHLALGRSYPETGGLNQSAIHWDLITDLRHGGRILLDGEEWQVNGQFI